MTALLRVWKSLNMLIKSSDTFRALSGKDERKKKVQIRRNALRLNGVVVVVVLRWLLIQIPLAQCLLLPQSVFKRSCHSKVCSMSTHSEKEWRKNNNTGNAALIILPQMGKRLNAAQAEIT